MQNHVRVYLNYFGYGEQDFIPCEYSGQRAVDIHHLIPRSQGGKDIIDNLMALSRQVHNKAHNDKNFNEELKKIHKKNLELFNEK